jgi:hypothetical protein
MPGFRLCAGASFGCRLAVRIEQQICSQCFDRKHARPKKPAILTDAVAMDAIEKLRELGYSTDDVRTAMRTKPKRT